MINMENIFKETVEAVSQGARFKVDFQNRNLRVNGKYIIKDNVYDGDLGVQFTSAEDALSTIEELYAIYRHSVPTERSEGKTVKYFNSLKEYELSDEDMMYGEQRDLAQIKLELYVLCMILSDIKWDDFAKDKWFWKSQAEPDLVLLKDWFEPNK